MIRCLIVDDEPIARRIIKKYLEKVPYLQLSGEAGSALEAADIIGDQGVDLIFLDIEMPDLNGIEFARSLNPGIRVILITAYPEFALQGYEINVLDYLVKPVSFSRFFQAVQKYPRAKRSPPEEMMISLKEKSRTYRIPVSSVQYLQAYGDYVKVYTSDRMYVVKDRLGRFEKILPDSFVRVHRSYVISTVAIQYLEGNRISIADTFIPLSASGKEALQAYFDSEI